MKKHWYDYLWIWTIIYFALGFFNILFAWLGMINFLVPLFISAFRIAVDLAMAMEARCYRGGQNRTRLHRMAYGKGDAVGTVVLIAYITGLIALRIVL